MRDRKVYIKQVHTHTHSHTHTHTLSHTQTYTWTHEFEELTTAIDLFIVITKKFWGDHGTGRVDSMEVALLGEKIEVHSHTAANAAVDAGCDVI